MSDTGIHLLIAAVFGLCVLGAIALLLLGYMVARVQFRGDIADRDRRLEAADAVILAAEDAGFIQTTTSGRHRATKESSDA